MSNRVYLYTTDDPQAGPWFDRAEAGSLNPALRLLFAEGTTLVASPVFVDRTALAVSSDRLRHLTGAGSERFDAFWREHPPLAWLVLVPDEVMTAEDAQGLCSHHAPSPGDVAASLHITRWSDVLYYTLTPEDQRKPERRDPRSHRKRPRSLRSTPTRWSARS